MIQFEYLWNAIWLLPLLLFWWRMDKKQRSYFLLVVFIGVTLALMKPVAVFTSKSPMLVVVFDRSLSISSSQLTWGKKSLQKILSLAPPEKIAVVTFGKNATVEKWFDDGFDGELFTSYVDPESSSLHDAILLGCSLLPVDKAGKIVLITDGEYRGVNPIVAATEAQRRNIKIDLIKLENTYKEDVGVSDISLPVRVAENELFQFSVSFFSTRSANASYQITRLGQIIAAGKVPLTAGETKLSFVDRVSRAGSHLYEAQIFYEEDEQVQNNKASAILQVDGAEKILVINTSGTGDNFTRALTGAGKDVEIIKAKGKEITLSLLQGYQLIVLENVPADRFREMELKALRIAVEDYGKSLLMTGGRASFGMGGYLNSILEPILPVDLTAKTEKRQLDIAVSVMLDRSGSMSMGVGNGKTKMDLANLGTDAVLRLLQSESEISVIAVDTAPHVIISMQKINDNINALSQKILSISSKGGGIFSFTALKAGINELSKATAGVRHLVLFADAADAEEYGDSVKLVTKVFENGITTSVVALGTESDADAEFLKDVAAAGGGRIYFTQDAESLPRLFTQDIVHVQRRSFEEQETHFNVGSGLSELGNFSLQKLPSVDGVNLNYL